jgi:tRNA (mo5U34)-methyltransferase
MSLLCRAVITEAITRQVEELGWYHTLELPGGQVTKGMFDLRDQLHHYGLPERMDGMRALDVGTWDGFWAFEMEKRGAEVIALDLDDERDLDWPPRRRPKVFPDTPRGAGFRLAKELLGSKVERVNLSIYHATPEEIGQFDFVFCGSVLIHLRDQLLALERIAGLTRGTFVSAEEYDPLSGFVPFPVSRYFADRDSAVVYWLPSIRTWRKMMWTAGFDKVEQTGKFKVRAREGWSVRHVGHRCSRDPAAS